MSLSGILQGMKRRKIILYRPGWISLLLLPLLCIVFLFEANTNKQYRLLKVFRITKESYIVRGDQATMFFHPPERHFQQINIGAQNREKVRKQLDTARNTLQKMIRTRDTVQGIHFHFEKQATHGVFVQILNLCNIAGVDHFVTLENDIHAYYQEKENRENQFSPVFFCGTGSLEREQVKTRIEMEKKSDQAHVFRKYLIELWPSGLMFILLSVLPFLPAIFKNFSQSGNRINFTQRRRV